MPEVFGFYTPRNAVLRIVEALVHLIGLEITLGKKQP
jgi:hypothetical protein